MNKRQAKKREKNMLLLQGMSYKESRKNDRIYKQYLNYYNHSHKNFKGFDEEERMLIEMGIFTPEEIVAKYGFYQTNNRWRQRRKQGVCILN